MILKREKAKGKWVVTIREHYYINSLLVKFVINGKELGIILHFKWDLYSRVSN